VQIARISQSHTLSSGRCEHFRVVEHEPTAFCGCIATSAGRTGGSILVQGAFGMFFLLRPQDGGNSGATGGLGASDGSNPVMGTLTGYWSAAFQIQIPITCAPDNLAGQICNIFDIVLAEPILFYAMRLYGSEDIANTWL
jgi:hypothetical protein